MQMPYTLDRKGDKWVVRPTPTVERIRMAPRACRRCRRDILPWDKQQ